MELALGLGIRVAASLAGLRAATADVASFCHIEKQVTRYKEQGLFILPRSL
ncbi:MAG: hypothetical protein ABIG71_03550 [Candidatus Uhrbacteria bacterium]